MEFGTKIIVLAIFVFVTAKASEIKELAVSDSTEDAKLTPRQLIKKYGYNGETHVVTTEDGYILEMHRITGPKTNPKADGKKPILIVHAFLSSSVDWVIIGPGKALAYLLADAGYDVWLGNLRGNAFSRKHKKYSYLDKKFWQFSWHECGMNDLPAMIDYVLDKTKQEQLTYLGYSMGTTSFWVMATQKPEYQEKVKAMFALAPVAYVHHVRSLMYRFLSHFNWSIEKIMSLLGHDDFEPSSELLKKIAAFGCDDSAWTQPLCTNIIFLIGGFGSDQLNTTMLPTLLAHVPAGGSVKEFTHYLQLVRDQKFQMYDHGWIGNWRKYRQFRPPLYDLSKIKVPVSLHYASNDWMSDPKDVHRLYEELGNPIGKFRVPHEKFGHLDFIWAIDVKQLLYNDLISLIGKYNN